MEFSILSNDFGEEKLGLMILWN